MISSEITYENGTQNLVCFSKSIDHNSFYFNDPRCEYQNPPDLGARMAYIATSEGVRGREWKAPSDRMLVKGEMVVQSVPLAAVLRVEHLSTHCSRCFISLSYSCDGGESTGLPLVCEGCSFFTVCHDCARVCQNKQGEKENIECDAVFQTHRECGECFVLQEQEMLDTTTRMLLRLEHTRRREAAAAQKAKDGRSGSEEKKSKESQNGASNASDEVPFLDRLKELKGLDLLEQHRESKSEETLKTYVEYVRLVLSRFRAVSDEGMDLGGEDEIDEIDDKVIAKHVGWLQAIQHNQHAITDDCE